MSDPLTPPTSSRQEEASPATTYVVLYTTELDPKWGEHKRVAARNAEAAIRAAIGDKIPDGAAQFVAIPARSWNPVTVTENVEKTLVIGGAA